MRTLIVAASVLLSIARVDARELVYVSNERSGSVTVIDAATDQVVDTVTVGGRPRGIQAAPDGSTVYVAVSRPSGGDPAMREGIVRIDVATQAVAGMLAVGTDPEQFAVGSHPPSVYVSNEDAGTASITDLASGEVRKTVVVGIEPEGVAISPDGRWVYVTAETSNTVSVIDTRSGEVVASFLVEARPRAAAFAPNSRLAFVTAEIGRAVSVVDVPKHAVVATFRFEPPVLAVGVDVAPDGRHVYVATSHANGVAVLDVSEPRRPKLATTIAVGHRPWGIALAAGGRTLYTANGRSNDVSVVDTATRTVRATIAAGDGPWGVAIARIADRPAPAAAHGSRP